jgi:hypothetical protein
MYRTLGERTFDRITLAMEFAINCPSWADESYYSAGVIILTSLLYVAIGAIFEA